MKNMRLFYEEWAATLQVNRQLPTDELPEDVKEVSIRQLTTAELDHEQTQAFLRTGFTRYL